MYNLPSASFRSLAVRCGFCLCAVAGSGLRAEGEVILHNGVTGPMAINRLPSGDSPDVVSRGRLMARAFTDSSKATVLVPSYVMPQDSAFQVGSGEKVVLFWHKPPTETQHIRLQIRTGLGRCYLTYSTVVGPDGEVTGELQPFGYGPVPHLEPLEGGGAPTYSFTGQTECAALGLWTKFPSFKENDPEETDTREDKERKAPAPLESSPAQDGTTDI